MSAASAIRAGRAAAERLMLDDGKALRPTGGHEYVDGKDVEATADLFESVCKIQARALAPREEQVGGRTSVAARLELHIPADTDPLVVGDLWEMTYVGDLSTVPVGRRYRVLSVFEKGLATARRYEVEAVVS